MNPVPQDGTQADEQPDVADESPSAQVPMSPTTTTPQSTDAPTGQDASADTPAQLAPPTLAGPGWVRWDTPPGAAEPLFAARRYWFAGTHYHLSEEEVAELDGIPGFVSE